MCSLGFLSVFFLDTLSEVILVPCTRSDFIMVPCTRSDFILVPCTLSEFIMVPCTRSDLILVPCLLSWVHSGTLYAIWVNSGALYAPTPHDNKTEDNTNKKNGYNLEKGRHKRGKNRNRTKIEKKKGKKTREVLGNASGALGCFFQGLEQQAPLFLQLLAVS